MVTLEVAYEYFNNERLFGEDWIMAENNKQEQSLKMAENQIMNLKFNNYVDDLKELRLQKAICEQALYLIQTANSQRSKLIAQGVTSFSVEGLSESYDIKARQNTLCLEAREFIKPYLLGCASIC